MSSAYYYSSSTSHNDRSRSHSGVSADPLTYPTSSSIHRATPSYPSNNDHAFFALYQRDGSLIPASPMSHTPQGIIPVPPQPDPSKRHQCTECGKCFDRPSALNTHMVTHTKSSLFPCTECDKSFGVRSNRTRHMREQHGICDSDVSNSSNRRSANRYLSSTPSEGSAQGAYYSSSR